MSDIDFIEQATNLLESVHLDTGEVYDQTPEARGLRLGLAQIHATVSLAHVNADMVKQQQLANLIAYAANHYPDARTATGDMIHSRIRDGLGLA